MTPELANLISTSAGLFVVSIFGFGYIWNNATGRDAGPPESMMLIASILGCAISLILFGVAVGYLIGINR